MNELIKLPDTRPSQTKRTVACGQKFYVTVSFTEDHKPAEVFCAIAKEGSTLAGFVNALMQTISICLQLGFPWEELSERYMYTNFLPNDHDNPSLLHAIAVAITSVIEHEKGLWVK